MRPHPLGTPGSGSPKAPIEIAEVVAYCLAAFPGVVQDRNWGERALFYNPDGRHPVYGWMSWIAIVDPSRRTFEELKPLLAEAYRNAIEKYRRRIRRPGS